MARIFVVISALIQEFDEDHRRKVNLLAGPLMDVAKSSKFLMCLVLFRDILDTLNALSRCFQAHQVRFIEVSRLLSATKATLTAEYGESPLVGGPSYNPLRGTIDESVSLVSPPVTVDAVSKPIL